MATHWNRIPWASYIINIVLIKTSILGLGIVSITLALGSYLTLRYKMPLSRDCYTAHHQKSCLRTLLLALLLHLAGYAFFITKLLLAESGSDMALALFSHGFAHHILSAVIAIVLILRVAKGLFSSEIAEPVVSH